MNRTPNPTTDEMPLPSPTPGEQQERPAECPDRLTELRELAARLGWSAPPDEGHLPTGQPFSA